MKSKILLVLCALFGLMMINGGLNKFFNYMRMPENMSAEMVSAMTAMTSLKWLMPLIAIAEIVGGILIAIPKYRALGAIIILPVTVGILLFNIVIEPSGTPIALALMAINIWAIADNWKKYLPMIQQNA